MDNEVFTDKAMIWLDEANKKTEFARYVVTLILFLLRLHYRVDFA